MPKKPSNRGGLRIKYHLQHADGTPADPKGVYFVLKLNSEDKPYARASCLGVLACADSIRTTNLKLSRDLTRLANKHWAAANTPT